MAHTDSPRADASPAYAADTAQTTEELRRFRRLLTQGRLGTHDYAVFLGLADARMPDLVREVRQGFPFGAFERLRRNTSWEADFLAALVDIPRRTLARRKHEGRFHADESDRLLRVS